MIGDEVPEADCPPELATVYELILAPPLLAGAVNATVALALPAVAVTPVGAPGA